VLEKVHGSISLVSKEIDGRAEYGTSRSYPISVMGHARNMEVPADLLYAINRWRAESKNATGNLRLDMADVYTTLKACLPIILCYSHSPWSEVML
jgi:hypothetical protein